jgi:hypothetical protein
VTESWADGSSPRRVPAYVFYNREYVTSHTKIPTSGGPTTTVVETKIEVAPLEVAVFKPTNFQVRVQASQLDG